MKRDTVNYAVVGTVVLAALAFLALVLLRITGSSGPTDSYSAVYEKVAGVRYGTPVYYQGYRVGEVERVVPERTGLQTRFRVWLAIDEDWPIPDDSVAQVASDGLLSDVFIDLREGQSNTPIPAGGELASREGDDLFAALGELAGQVRELTDAELKPLLQRVNASVAVIAENFEAGTPRLISQASDLLESLERSASGVEDLVGPENRATMRELLENFRQSSTSAAALAEELRKSRAELDAVLLQAQALISDNRPEIDRMVRGLALTLDQLSARVDNIAFNLDEASRNFNEFTRSIRRSPNRLLFTPDADAVKTEDTP